MKVAIGCQLIECRAVHTVGLKCNWQDYSASAQRCIRDADTVYFPTIFYAAALHGAGKRIFPSINCYTHLGNKVRQTALFSIAAIPVPETRIFHGSRKKEKILAKFTFPFIAKIPHASGGGAGVFLVNDERELDRYLSLSPAVYIQEYLALKRDIRVVVIGRKPVLAYWKKASGADFRNNIARGATIDFSDVPDIAIKIAADAAMKCGIDHAGFDLAESGNGFVVIEANMKFGTEGFVKAGMSYKELLCTMVSNNEI